MQGGTLRPGGVFLGKRQSLGCALSGAGALLMRLARGPEGQVRVAAQWQVDWPVTAEPDPQGAALLPGHQPPHEPPGLRQLLRAQRQQASACMLALPERVVASGQLPWPPHLSEDMIEAEILLEAAQALQLPPASIGYDFEAFARHDSSPAPPPGSGTTMCRWSAASLDSLSHWRRALRAAGLRLQAVEPQEQAARRALALIEGQDAALWRQAPQDWRFQLAAGAANGSTQARDMQAFRSDVRVTHLWLPLVACGLALRKWQEDS